MFFHVYMLTSITLEIAAERSLDSSHHLLALSVVLQSLVGKLPDYPHPVASSISSRMMVELGMVTAFMVAAAAVVGGFLASAVFAVTSFVFGTTVYVLWPITKPLFKILSGILSNIFERIWDNLLDIVGEGGLISSKIYEFYAFGGVSASIEAMKPIAVVLATMVLLVRFTLSRRPKNFRKWVSSLSAVSFLILLILW